MDEEITHKRSGQWQTDKLSHTILTFCVHCLGM